MANASKNQIALRRKWVKALRSGKYKQTQSKLFDGKGYCCLGVLCKVAGVKPVKNKLDFFEFMKQEDCLPATIRKQIGLNTDYGQYNVYESLATDNDNGLTFKQIADIIESQPEGLFRSKGI